MLSHFVIYGAVALYLIARYFAVTLPAYWFYWKRNPEWTGRYRIQNIPFRSDDLAREIRDSVASIFVAAIFTFWSYDPVLRDGTLMYTGLLEKGWIWLFASFYILLFIHDAYFYWIHRWLHHPRLYRWTHFIHHKSRNPSPFATFSFGLLDAGLQFAWILPLLYLMPINVWVLGLFSLNALVVNAVGHSGIEAFPAAWAAHPLFKWINRPYLHNLHHQRVDANYGLYFTFWDKWMGTYVD